MILICYDGSADPKPRFDRAGLLMPGSDARVLVIWKTTLEMLTRNGSRGMGLKMIGGYDEGETDAAIKQAALDTRRRRWRAPRHRLEQPGRAVAHDTGPN